MFDDVIAFTWSKPSWHWLKKRSARLESGDVLLCRELAVPIATFAANIKAMVTKAQAAGWAVILATVPPRGTGVTAPMKLATYCQNLWLKRYAAAQNIPLVDYC